MAAFEHCGTDGYDESWFGNRDWSEIRFPTEIKKQRTDFPPANYVDSTETIPEPVSSDEQTRLENRTILIDSAKKIGLTAIVDPDNDTIRFTDLTQTQQQGEA